MGCGTGSLDREEVRQLLQLCSGTGDVTDSELDAAMKDLDADGSGEVDLDEFMQYFKDQQDQVRYTYPYSV